MKIGIVTITGESNYGNSLQNYALIKTLDKFGINAETMKTEYEPSFTPNTKDNIKQYIKVVLKYGNYLSFIRSYRFKQFSNKYLSKTESVTSEAKPLDAVSCDVLIFGSDQIWNYTMNWRICDGIDYYTGNFAPDVPKIAYSASIGANFIPDEYKKIVAENLSKFKAISVREEQAKNILGELIHNDVKVTVDPTLLLTKDEWLKIAKKPGYINDNQNFVLTYFLGAIETETSDYINAIADENNFEIINLQSEWVNPKKIRNSKHFLTEPTEFLWLVANCELMLTDSFHGSVFSIIMDKPFRCFERIDKVESMTSRMDTLFSTFQVDGWCKGDIKESLEHVFYKDYSSVGEILDEKRRFALDYLTEALGVNET